MSNCKEIRIGVIGVGGRGNIASHAHKPGEGSRLVAGADIAPTELEKFKEDYGPEVLVTKDYREILAREDIDAVFVTSPDFLHEEHALAALEAGKHVYLEKPMTITIDGCDKLLQKAFEKKLKLYLGHNMRHMSFVQKMKELIDSGAIGEVIWKSQWINVDSDFEVIDFSNDVPFLQSCTSGNRISLDRFNGTNVHPQSNRSHGSWRNRDLDALCVRDCFCCRPCGAIDGINEILRRMLCGHQRQLLP